MNTSFKPGAKKNMEFAVWFCVYVLDQLGLGIVLVGLELMSPPAHRAKKMRLAFCNVTNNVFSSHRLNNIMFIFLKNSYELNANNGINF